MSTVRASRRTLMDDVLDKLHHLAETGEPDPDNWTCGSCGRDGADGVRSWPYLVILPGGSHDIQARLTCPCCSVKGCPHTLHFCPTCNLPTDPPGTVYGGGPYSRCRFDGNHPASDFAP